MLPENKMKSEKLCTCIGGHRFQSGSMISNTSLSSNVDYIICIVKHIYPKLNIFLICFSLFSLIQHHLAVSTVSQFEIEEMEEALPIDR